MNHIIDVFSRGRGPVHAHLLERSKAEHTRVPLTVSLATFG